MRPTDIKPVRKFWGWMCRMHAANYTGFGREHYEERKAVRDAELR